jgi:hypothetical protein
MISKRTGQTYDITPWDFSIAVREVVKYVNVTQSIYIDSEVVKYVNVTQYDFLCQFILTVK